MPITAKPDGSIEESGATAVRRALVQLCPIRKPRCPKCGFVMPNTRVLADGSTLYACDVRRVGREDCDGRAVVFGVGGSLCLVVALTHAEFDAADRGGHSSLELVEELKLLGATLIQLDAPPVYADEPGRPEEPFEHPDDVAA